MIITMDIMVRMVVVETMKRLEAMRVVDHTVVDMILIVAAKAVVEDIIQTVAMKNAIVPMMMTVVAVMMRIAEAVAVDVADIVRWR